MLAAVRSTPAAALPSSSTWVSARSYPKVAFGPVSIETQKHVPPASVQLTARTNTSRRRTS